MSRHAKWTPLASPSPLWGGDRGGGASASERGAASISQATRAASPRLAPRPPLLSSPHKGERDANACPPYDTSLRKAGELVR